MLGTDGQAPAAVRTVDRRALVKEAHRLGDDALFFVVERREVLHIGGVVLELRHVRHAGEHHHHIVKAGGIADGPGGVGECRLLLPEKRFDRLRHVGQHAALDRLHDDDRLVVPRRDLVAGPGLHDLAVPVEVVELELDVFHLRVLGQNVFEHRRAVVEGKTEVPDLSLLFELCGLLENAQLHGVFIARGVERVEPVVVHIVRAEPRELLREKAAGVAALPDEKHGQLRRDREARARVPLHERLPQRVLALAAVVDVGRVKIGKAVGEKFVRHGAKLRDVHPVRRAERRQTHTAKAEFFHVSVLLVAFCVQYSAVFLASEVPICYHGIKDRLYAGGALCTIISSTRF